MEITNFFKTTKAPYASNSKYLKRNSNTLLNKESGAEIIQIEQNKLKDYIECKYLGNIGNYSEESSEGEIGNYSEESSKGEILDKEKQVKLDAFIKKISQDTNTCNIEHHGTNYSVLNEINASPTNFNQLSSRENLNSCMDEGLDNIKNLNSGTSELLKIVQDGNILAEDTSTSKYLNQQFSDYFKNRYSVFEGMNDDNMYKTKDTEIYNYDNNLDYKFPECLNIDEKYIKKTQNLNVNKIGCSKEERLSNLINNLNEKSSGNNTGVVRNVLTNLENLKPILKGSTLFSRVPSVYSTDLCSEISDEKIDNKENELIQTKIVFEDIADDGKFFECLTEKVDPSPQFSNITRNYDEADKYLQKVNITTSPESDDTILQKYSPIPGFIEYQGIYNRTRIENNKINHPTVDNYSNFTPNMANLEENVCIQPKTVIEDLATDSFRDFGKPQSLEIPQIFSSKQFLEGNCPVFEDTHNTDSLCPNSVVVTSENMLNDEEIYGFLSKGYEKHLKKQEVTVNTSLNVSRIEKLTQQIPFNQINRSNNENCLKRYKKGKTRIYRLKKLKKLQRKSSGPELKEEFGIKDVLKHITQSFIHPETQFSKSDSCSSISTSSSYITDDGKSEGSTGIYKLITENNLTTISAKYYRFCRTKRTPTNTTYTTK